MPLSVADLFEFEHESCSTGNNLAASSSCKDMLLTLRPRCSAGGKADPYRIRQKTG